MIVTRSSSTALSFGYRSRSEWLSCHEPFCDFDHPNVIAGLGAILTEPQVARWLPTRCDLVFRVGMRDGRVTSTPHVNLAGEAWDAINALARRLREDVLWIGELLARIPFTEIARVLAPWIVDVATLNSRDLLDPDDIKLDHGPSIIVNPRLLRDRPWCTHAETARDPAADVQERIVFDIPGLPPATVVLPRRGKPRVTIPGVPATHALHRSERANKAFRIETAKAIAVQLERQRPR